MIDAPPITLQAVIRMALTAQAIEAMRAARRGAGYDPRQWGWDEELAVLAMPAIDRALTRGRVTEARRWAVIPPLARMFGARIVLRKKFGGTFSGPASSPAPEIAEAARRMSFDFARSINATTAEKLQQAYIEFRRELVTWAERNEAIGQLTQRIRRIIADPKRAAMVAQTEGARAMEAGRMIAAKAAPIRLGKRWILSEDACDLCKELAKNRIPRGLDEPFYVHPGGGVYAVVQHPPAHPWCRCATAYVPL